MPAVYAAQLQQEIDQKRLQRQEVFEQIEALQRSIQETTKVVQEMQRREPLLQEQHRSLGVEIGTLKTLIERLSSQE